MLSPAHQRLFSPFDAAIGHFRRYSRSMLRGISPPDLRLERLRYLDSVGLTASARQHVAIAAIDADQGAIESMGSMDGPGVASAGPALALFRRQIDPRRWRRP